MTVSSVFQQLLCTTPQHVRRHPLRYLLSLVSIAVAVMLFVSMRITQESIVHAFQGNLDALAGNAQFRIVAPGGVDEQVLETVEKTRGVTAAPIVQAAAVLTQHRQTIMLLGVSPAREARLRGYRLDQGVQLDLPTLLLNPDAVVIPRRLADRFGYKLGDKIGLTGPVAKRDYAIAGILRSDGPAVAMDGNIVFMEISAVQRFVGRAGRFDRIEIAIDSPERLETLRKALGDSADLEPIRGRNATFDYITSQFQTILVCFSLLASVIGLFIVYNTMSLSVVQRAKEIGTLRLGASRREILAVITGEAALVGLIASLLGAVGGRAVAAYALHQTATTLSIMLDLGAPKIVVPTDAWILAPIVGMLAAILGAWVPARAAAMLPPTAAMKPGGVESNMRRRTGLWLVLGLAMLIFCAIVVRHPRTEWQPTVAGLMAGLFGVALAGPQLLIWTSPIIRRLTRRLSNAPAFLALHNIIQNPSRTSLTTIALGGSLSLVIAMASMISGLDQEISRWMDDVLVFDLTLQSNDMSSTAFPTSSFPAQLLDEVRRDPECAEAYGVRSRLLPFRGDEIMLITYDTDAVQKGRIERGRSKNPAVDLARAAALQAGKVEISANLARIHGLARGDRLTFDTPTKGPQSFVIHSIQTDYTWFRGCIFMERAIYRSLWNDESLSYLDIRVRPAANQGPATGDDIAHYQAKLTTRLSNRYGLYVYRLDELMDFARRFTREWFAMANMQLLLSVIVGGVGVANTLLVSLLTQARQIGLLRAIGASARQIQQLLAIEAALLGAIGGLAGCVIGLAIARFLLVPMTLKASGHDIPMIVPYQAMAYAALAAVAIALGAAILPLRAVRRIDVLQAIGYE